MPLQKSISPYKGTPVLAEFNTEEFIQSLDSSLITCEVKELSGLNKKIRQPSICVAEFVKRFCQTANFQGWYNQKRQEANSILQELHIKTLCDTDWLDWCQGRPEVEVVDQLIRMHDKQMCLKETQGVHSKYRTGLAKHIENIISTLPPDLSSVLVNLRPSEAGS
ncbi:hypothetical protein EB796_019873 [Bugula neritina]|uniref:Uncharacterized protein n=1 Tax=Bugula neritina TaxID=10212 RepID=A0A7J7J7B0_BUGNE|nr:hypothetical protein EB796_019873 [Bugula neritina]